MLKETWDLLLTLLVSFVLILGSSFYLGCKYEQFKISQKLPSVMDSMCQDCYTIGEKKGLKTCDDMIDQINKGGTR